MLTVGVFNWVLEMTKYSSPVMLLKQSMKLPPVVQCASKGFTTSLMIICND